MRKGLDLRLCVYLRNTTDDFELALTSIKEDLSDLLVTEMNFGDDDESEANEVSNTLTRRLNDGLGKIHTTNFRQRMLDRDTNNATRDNRLYFDDYSIGSESSFLNYDTDEDELNESGSDVDTMDDDSTTSDDTESDSDQDDADDDSTASDDTDSDSEQDDNDLSDDDTSDDNDTSSDETDENNNWDNNGFISDGIRYR